MAYYTLCTISIDGNLLPQFGDKLRSVVANEKRDSYPGQAAVIVRSATGHQRDVEKAVADMQGFLQATGFVDVSLEAKLAKRLNAATGSRLTKRNVADWVSSTGPTYRKTDRVVRKYLGAELYEAAVQTARMLGVLDARLDGAAFANIGGVRFNFQGYDCGVTDVFGRLLKHKEPSRERWSVYIPGEGNWPLAYAGDNKLHARKAYLQWAGIKRLPRGAVVVDMQASKK